MTPYDAIMQAADNIERSPQTYDFRVPNVPGHPFFDTAYKGARCMLGEIGAVAGHTPGIGVDSVSRSLLGTSAQEFYNRIFAELPEDRKEQNVQTTPGGPVTEVRIRRYFDAPERDAKIELYRVEPSVIDATLEVTNAVTDLLEG